MQLRPKKLDDLTWTAMENLETRKTVKSICSYFTAKSIVFFITHIHSINPDIFWLAFCKSVIH